jgi:hypothetical protein
MDALAPVLRKSLAEFAARTPRNQSNYFFADSFSKEN